MEGTTGLRITDRIDRRGFELRTDSQVDPEPTSTDVFPNVVNAAVDVSVDRLTVPASPSVYIYDDDQEPLGDFQEYSTRRLGDGRFYIQLETVLKLYVSVEGPLRIVRHPDSTSLTLPDTATVTLGIRRHEDRPVGTITTTTEPCDIMRALSHLGSSLMTTGPRRSYPSLRGHPPAIELGDGFGVPDDIDAPTTGITIELPPDLERAYVAAPLSRYLPARLVPGDHPRLVTDEGFARDLAGATGYEAEVERVLKQTFFMDCLAREEITTETTVEQNRVADRLPIDVKRAGELPPAERLERYLEPDFETIAEYVPRWKLVAHVQPSPRWVEVLPYLMNDLAVITTAGTAERRRMEPTPGTTDGSARDRAVRSSGNAEAVWGVSDPTFVEVEEADSVEQAWVGEGIPIGASKSVPEAFRNRMSREESDDQNLRIEVVCNDDGMLDEGFAVGEVYGSRDDLPFDVSIHKDLSSERFRTLLTDDIDFLHYVGHIDETGFECSDGSVDARELESVSVDSFVLNACHSYAQGLALIHRGAIGGVVTLDEVVNSGAIRVGKTMARLLNLGFPLRPALSIARQRSIFGGQYLVVGDGNFDIARGLGQNFAEVRTTPDGFKLSVTSYPTRIAGLGSIFNPANSRPGDDWYLIGSRHIEYAINRNELSRYLDTEVQPILFDGDFTWSDRIDLEDRT